jgi:hypothetical protein
MDPIMMINDHRYQPLYGVGVVKLDEKLSKIVLIILELPVPSRADRG